VRTHIHKRGYKYKVVEVGVFEVRLDISEDTHTHERTHI